MIYSLIKELETVICEMDSDDHSNPEVQVSGVGRYKLNTLKRNVREKLADLAKGVADSDDPETWRQAAWKLEHGAMKEMMRTIIKADKELENV